MGPSVSGTVSGCERACETAYTNRSPIGHLGVEVSARGWENGQRRKDKKKKKKKVWENETS